ncbi:MAG: minichromosome maintenance protein MCM [Halobacteria archaeon]
MEELNPKTAPGRAAAWQAFLERYKLRELDRTASRYPEERSLPISVEEVLRFDPALADALYEEPEAALREIQAALRAVEVPGGLPGRINVRIHGLSRDRVVPIRDLRSHHIGKLIAVEALVRQAQEIRPRLVRAAFQCPWCGEEQEVEQPESGRFAEPGRCANDSCRRGGRPFRLLVKRSTFVDSQRLRLEEYPEDLSGGQQPQKLPVVVEDDLAGAAAPGDRVVLNGILRSYQRVIRNEKSTTFDILLDGLSVEVREKEFADVERSITEEDISAIHSLAKDPAVYDKVIRSIAPSIYDCGPIRAIKESIALQLFAGVSKELPDGSHIRGDIHILLVGDPGTAKSMLLRYVTQLAPRSIYTSGRGSTAAGLTATAIRDDEGRWSLEAGALVIANNGVACVDEIDKMREEDRSALHEALEQQTVSVAKAGITATLRSRCSLLGAANPKLGRFDRYESIATQVDLPPGLMSRFDLIFPLTDEPRDEEDRRLAEHVLRSHHAGEMARAGREGGAEALQIRPEIPPDFLRKYVAYARTRVFPVMGSEALEKFREFYVSLRKSASEEAQMAVPVTARQLEGLVRLGEASARLRLSGVVEVSDAERAIRLVHDCLKKVGINPETGDLDVDFAFTGIGKPQKERAKRVEQILEEMGGQEHPVSEEDLLREAVDRGMDREKAEKTLEQLHRNGEIYYPATGKVMRTRKG